MRMIGPKASLVGLLIALSCHPTAAMVGEVDCAEDCQAALRLLMSTDEFASPFIDYGGIPSPQAVAFATVLMTPDAEALFRILQAEGSPPGQLYGLCGLYLVSRQEFKRVVPQYDDPDARVQTHFGCTVGERKLVAVVDEIRRGRWPRALREFAEHHRGGQQSN